MKALKIASDAFVTSGRDMREFIITISEDDERNKNDADDFSSSHLWARFRQESEGLVPRIVSLVR